MELTLGQRKPDQSHVADNVEDRADLFGLLGRVWRRKFAVLLVGAVLLAPAAVVIERLTPQYHAETQILVDDRRTQILGLPDIRSTVVSTEDIVLSEVQVLQSRTLAREVIGRLSLSLDPEFNATLRPPSASSLIVAKIRDWLRSIPQVAKYLPVHATTTTSETDDPEARVVDAFLSKLSVLPTGKSRVIRVIFDSQSPMTAARVANALAAQYLSDQIATKVDAAKTATAWMEEHLVSLRADTERARAAKDQYRRDNNLYVSDRDTTLNTQEASQINQQLTVAVARQTEAEARLASATGLMQRGDTGMMSELIQSPGIQSLRQQESLLLQKIAELETSYGANFPAAQRAVAQLHDLRQTIARETARVVESFMSDVVREKQNVARLTAALTALKQKVGEDFTAESRVTTLDRDITSSDSIYQLFLDRVKQVKLEEGTQQADSAIISRADPPGVAYFPNRTMLLSLAALTSLAAGCCISLLLDSEGKTFIGIDQVQSSLRSDVIGFVPLLRRFSKPQDAFRFSVRADGRPGFAEAMRNLHVRLLVSSGTSPKTVMFASALPHEGKSSTAIGFATLMAQTGRQIVLVDCDTRRPQAHRAFNQPRGAGLTDYLDGASLPDVLRSIEGTSLAFISAGAEVSHPAGLLSSDRMALLLSTLGDRFDMVVLDSPPILAVPDALLLGRLVDKCVFLIQWAKTPHAAAARALGMLRASGAHVAGTVLTMVDMDKMVARDPAARHYDRHYS